MKQMTQTIRYTLIAMMLVSTSYAAGQNLSDSDYPFIYDSDEIYPNYSPRPGDTYPIQLYPILDEITLRKVPEMQKEEFETLVKSYLPDAIFDWKRYGENVCMVEAGSDIPDIIIDDLYKEDAITFLYRSYTRKLYKDLMDIYPVKEIAVYGFNGIINFGYLNNEIVEKADSLIESKGLEIINQYGNRGSVLITKDMDIIAVANELYESGYFFAAVPVYLPAKIKTLSSQPIDKFTLPFYYNYSGNKQYLYELYDRFMIKKSPSLNKSALESVIKGQLVESDIIWENDSLCTVVTIPEKVEAAMESMFNEDGVLRVSHKYFSVGDYEATLKEGVKTPESFGFTGVIGISFKDIAEEDKAKIISDYNLKLVDGNKEINSWEYEVPNTSDVLAVSQSIFETGLVKYSIPITTTVYRIIFWGPSSNVEKVTQGVKEIATQYYNLSGQRINAPTGLTIVVTSYSDGTVHTEKRLF